MYNENLEQDLRQYAKSQDGELFDNNLYQPLSQLFKWVCRKRAHNLSNADFEDIQQQVMLLLIKSLTKYREDKGMSAVSFVRMVMHQELTRCKKKIDALKSRTTNYDIEIHNRAVTTEDKTIEAYKSRLTEYHETAPCNERKIIKVIIDGLSNPRVCTMNNTERIDFIRTKSKSTKCAVKKTIQKIREEAFFMDM